jgi:EAL domain-containing protein (putative c-di-GMP-specific phosphodiesterase class I)
MNSCIHCGISFDFYEQGFFFIESNTPNPDLPQKYHMINDYLGYLQYESLKQVEQEVSDLNNQDGVRIGLSRSKRVERLIDVKTFLIRYEEKETVNFIQHGEMISHLQPIIDMNSNEIFGYESLLRASSPAVSLSPGKLFQVATQTGLHSLLDQRAREEAIKARNGKIMPGIKSFINFLPSTIYNPDFCLQHTFRIVEKYKINPADLIFEVVETEKILDIDHLRTVLDRYKKEGMKVALDDVGAGFSTVDMLELLQPDYVKIDRSYISFCDQDTEKQRFLKDTNNRAQALGIKTLAEGIERIEEFELCKSLGYNLAQGYLIGKPEANPSLDEAWLARSTR